MATSSIHNACIIKDEAALNNFIKALENPRQLPDVKPITEEERRKGKEAFDTWLLNHSGKK